MIWRCPRCRGKLVEVDGGARCQLCHSLYESIGGILDLRLPGASWIDYETDIDNAKLLIEEMAGLNAEQLIRHVYSSRPDWDERLVSLRTRQVISAPDRLRNDLSEWLKPCLTKNDLFLDIGCGFGVLLAAASAEGFRGVGIDVSLELLVVARQLILAYGGRPTLAAALAENLPLPGGSVFAAISLDVIEHVADPGTFIREIDRVVKRDGYFALSTPNRYSLAPEPHVSVWGVGWLPRRWQKRYVKWRTGKNYDFAKLLSIGEIEKLIRQHSNFVYEILIPPIPDEEILNFQPLKAILAKIYNNLIYSGWKGRLFVFVGPFFRVIGKKC